MPVPLQAQGLESITACDKEDEDAVERTPSAFGPRELIDPPRRSIFCRLWHIH
jgi:hypothetical protein